MVGFGGTAGNNSNKSDTIGQPLQLNSMNSNGWTIVSTIQQGEVAVTEKKKREKRKRKGKEDEKDDEDQVPIQK